MAHASVLVETRHCFKRGGRTLGRRGRQVSSEGGSESYLKLVESHRSDTVSSCSSAQVDVKSAVREGVAPASKGGGSQGGGRQQNSGPSMGAGEATTKVFVGGIPAGVSSADMRTYFEPFGNVTDAAVPSTLNPQPSTCAAQQRYAGGQLRGRLPSCPPLRFCQSVNHA